MTQRSIGFNIEIAGLVVHICSRAAYFREFCEGYIVTDNREPDITVEVSEEEIEKRIKKNHGMYFGKRNAEIIMTYEKISNALPAFDAFVMHSSVVEVDDQAYCFAAESGTGKSTHTKYWKEVLGDRMKVINGDKPIYRFINKRLTAYGTPWNGKERFGENISAPLQGLCLLERGEKNEIYPIDDPFMALGELMKHFHLSDAGQVDVPKLMELIDRMLRQVRLYKLRCTDDISAAQTAIRRLIGEIC